MSFYNIVIKNAIDTYNQGPVGEMIITLLILYVGFGMFLFISSWFKEPVELIVQSQYATMINSAHNLKCVMCSKEFMAPSKIAKQTERTYCHPCANKYLHQ